MYLEFTCKISRPEKNRLAGKRQKNTVRIIHCEHDLCPGNPGLTLFISVPHLLDNKKMSSQI